MTNGTWTPVHFFRDVLEHFTYFDETFDEISSSVKPGGSVLHVYLTDIRERFLTEAPQDGSIIIKELSAGQADVYQKLSMSWNPYLETIYGVLEKDGHFISINEFIKAPQSLPCAQRSLSLEEYTAQFGCLGEMDALRLAFQLADGMEALRGMNLTHGDISPQNILLTDAVKWNGLFCPAGAAAHNMAVKIIDFDIAKEKKDGEHEVTSIMGTGLFAAPEILDYRYPSDKVDIYSLGCILHYMITGHSPKNYDGRLSRKQLSRGTLRIIRRCTAGYDVRYKNTSQLKKDILHQLYISPSLFSACLYSIPGLRSRTPWKTAAALCIYTAFIRVFFLIPQTAKSVFAALFLLGEILVFDMLHIGDRFPAYTYLKFKYPLFQYLVKLLIGAGILILFCLLANDI